MSQTKHTTETERSGNQPEGLNKWTLWDSNRENAKHFDKRGAAEEHQEYVETEFGFTPELYEPGNSPEALYHAEENRPDDTDDASEEPEGDDDGVPCTECGEPVNPDAIEFDGDRNPYHPDCWANGGDSVEAEIVETTTDADAVEVENANPEPVEPTPDAPAEDVDLPDRSVADDPLTWIPGEFVDEIDGSQAINRKGFEVLSHFYDVDVDPDMQVVPEETDHTYCRVRCVATLPDGREVAAFGSAHVDRGDDADLLTEMADTRARKRALSIATGVGAVAVAELKNEVQQ